MSRRKKKKYSNKVNSPSPAATPESIASAESAVETPAEPESAVETPAELKVSEEIPAEPESAVEIPAEPESAVEIPAEPESAVEIPAEPESAVETPAEPKVSEESPAEPEEGKTFVESGDKVTFTDPEVSKDETIVAAEVDAPAETVSVGDPFDCPDVSVVIPMYNAENYIAEVLNSLRAQTFKNFEVIVVDDCSSDNSPAIVDSFIPKFKGRLTHFRLRRNSGGAGIPRNNGINLARGEYIYFMDSDDLIVPNALKDDFKLAKQYDADVLYHTLFFNLSADGTKSTLAKVPKYQPGDEVELDEDLLTRVRELAQNKYYHAPWRSFSKRKFLIENELYFPNIRPYEDIVWNYALLIYCKRFLRVPTATYFYRDNENSMLRTEKSAAQNAKFYLNPIILGLKSLDTFISRNSFFDNKPQLYYALLENYFNGRFTSLFRDNSSELQSFALYETLKDEFGKNLGDYDVLIPVLCAALAQQQQVTATKLTQFKEYVFQSRRRIAELEREIKRRKRKG